MRLLISMSSYDIELQCSLCIITKVTFSEITVYPGAGFEKFPTKDFDLSFGEYWNQLY